MLDVVEAIDGTEPAFRCAEIRRRGPAARPAREYPLPCAIHVVMNDGRRGVAARSSAGCRWQT